MVSRRGYARQRGVTYLAAILAVAILGAGLGAVGQVWRTVVLRDKEKELLFVGKQYRRAIQYYYESTPGSAPRYPRTLESLLLDERYPAVRRYLRQLYRDPVTDSADWGLLLAPDGGIAGVFSKSTAKPWQQGGFAAADAGFENAASYSNWIFSFGTPATMPGDIEAGPGSVPRGTPALPTQQPTRQEERRQP